ncbi:MAG: class I SAM-dependent methyltransferase [Leptolyngbyaceae cyanobacterium MO_188.B28]|nr:class I SAM-dependent methyltransferase [Leptolyngbyaceae cyanobacterium MO_188.B28]
MGFYSRVLLPRLLDWSMSGEGFAHYRRTLLADVKGDVLEIGFGTGLNLQHYPKGVSRLTVVDPNPGMATIAETRIAASPFAIDTQLLSSEALPMADDTFDSVVSTWTLCSIPNIDQALQEIHRVLKPTGRFFFIEHGRSPDLSVQIWQDRLTPIQRVIADGCHLNRPMQTLLERYFKVVTVDRFYAEGLPRIAGYMYRGVAAK